MPLIQIDKLLRPKSIAVVGASTRDTATGTRVLRNLQRFQFPGHLYPINPRYKEILGLRCYPSLSELPERVDLVFIAIPAEGVNEILKEAGGCGIGGAIVNASGFADAGPQGHELQEELATTANAYGIAVCGPNNMGLINVHDRICMWTAGSPPPLHPGSVALISQSGSVAIALSQDDRHLGLAYVISAGNEAVCTAAEYLQAMLRSPDVRVVMMFLETIREPRLFAEAAMEAARLGKRIVAVKVGRSQSGSVAVAAHTGALSGEDKVYDAYFRRYGVVRVSDLDELIEAAKLFLAYPEPPPTPHTVPITMSGGEAALVADIAEQLKLSTPDFCEKTVERIKPGFSPFATPRNPLDAYGQGWNVENFRVMVNGLLPDSQIGVIACSVDAPASGGADTSLSLEMAAVCNGVARSTEKRFVFLNNTAGGGVNPAVEKLLDETGIPYLSGMSSALGAIAKWARFRVPDQEITDDASPQSIDWRRWASRAGTLSDPERFSFLSNVGVKMADCIAVSSTDEALKAAAKIGYPVVMKGCAPDLLHKTESGLVRIGLKDVEMVKNAFAELADRLRKNSRARDGVAVVVQPMVSSSIELLVGVRNDKEFGSIIVVGLGGTLVEVVREVSLRIGPVKHQTALEMLNETRAGTLLAGVRGRGPFDLEAAADAVVALSRFGVATQSIVSSVEVNPLMVLERGRGVIGVDVVMELATGDSNP